MRMIDADALKAELDAWARIIQKPNHYAREDALYIIDCALTIDAAPVVRGEWIQKHHIISLDNMTLTGTYPTCSLCGYAWIGVAKNTNYCPNCGAKMEDKP